MSNDCRIMRFAMFAEVLLTIGWDSNKVCTGVSTVIDVRCLTTIYSLISLDRVNGVLHGR